MCNKENDNLKAKSETNLFLIKCITNLHVGSGEMNFSIVDNEVQKDPITEIPMIHSSSLKGALREFFTKDMNKGDCNMVTYIFGPKADSDNKSKEGNYKFFEAHLLARPVRSNKKPYFMATCPSIIKNFLSKLDIFKIKLNDDIKNGLEELKNGLGNHKAVIFENLNDVILEDTQAIYVNNTTISKEIKNLLGENIAILSDDEFKKLTLPVIARNKLDNGESKNLWYEEIVPRESVFYFFITRPTNLDKDDEKEKINGFENNFYDSFKDNLVQFGANKSIGYGFCKVEKQ
jgi:CRISPR-associated protein Cmr4